LICHRDAGQRFEEINPVDSELANDRTFLAWLRTGIACFGLGFVVAKAALIINAGGTSVPYRGWYSLTGVLIVLAGVALVVAGLWQHRHVFRTLRPDVAMPMPQWPATMTTVAVVAGVALSTLLTISA
jgi:inner membrane protein YidH